MFKKIENVIFCAAFFMMTIAPLLFANKRDGAISAAENRKLAAPAKFYNEDGTLNRGFSEDFETWFDDNLGFRDVLVEANGVIKYHIFDEIKNMRLGKNGELAPFSVLADYQHTNLADNDELKRIVEAYQTVYDYLNSQGIQVYYMQCWDKHSIYPEQYKDTIQIFGDVSRSDQVEKALIEQTDIHVVPIKNTLLQLKEKYNSYGTWAEPWHWVQRGGYIAYTELIREINHRNGNRYKELCEDDFDISLQDIGQTFYERIHKADYEEIFLLKNPHAVYMPEKLTYVPEVGLREQVTYYENNSVDNEDTILILGDSYYYTYNVITNLAESFHNTIMFNGTAATQDNLIRLIDIYEPDIVVFENAERCNYRYEEMIGNAIDIISRSYDKGEDILFYSDLINSQKYVINGFSEQEGSFTWTAGDTANLFLYANGFDADKTAVLHIDFRDVFNNEQTIRILINGNEVYNQKTVSNGRIDAEFVMPQSKMISIRFDLKDAVSPFKTGQSQDTRQLGLQITKMKIEQ